MRIDCRLSCPVGSVAHEGFVDGGARRASFQEQRQPGVPIDVPIFDVADVFVQLAAQFGQHAALPAQPLFRSFFVHVSHERANASEVAEFPGRVSSGIAYATLGRPDASRDRIRHIPSSRRKSGPPLARCQMRSRLASGRQVSVSRPRACTPRRARSAASAARPGRSRSSAAADARAASATGGRPTPCGPTPASAIDRS